MTIYYRHPELDSGSRQLNKTWIPDQVRNDSGQKGFIALISVIIIFAVLLVFAMTIATSSFFTRFNILDYENKKVSVALAEACAEIAMVNLAKDTNYGSSTPVTVTVDAGKICKICSVSTSSPYTILTRAVYGTNGKAYTNLKIVGSISVGNFAVTSWDEQPTYTGAGICTLP